MTTGPAPCTAAVTSVDYGRALLAPGREEAGPLLQHAVTVPADNPDSYELARARAAPGRAAWTITAPEIQGNTKGI